MVRRRATSLVATLAILMLAMSSIFAGTAVAQPGTVEAEDAPRTLQQTEISADYLCKSYFTGQFRLVFDPICKSNEQLIQVSASLPFDYCYSFYTGVLSDDRDGDQCRRGEQYVEIDGLSSFFACYNLFTGRLYHLNSPDECASGILTFFFDFRGDLTKFACVEENLHDALCDSFPAGGSQNEIRQLESVTVTPFISSSFRLVFQGDQTAILSGYSAVDTSPAGIEAALEVLPSIGVGNVSVTALNPGEQWSKAFDDFNTPDDESTPIRVEFIGSLGGQDIVDPIVLINVQSTGGGQEATVIDGSPASPGLNNVMPGGTVQVFKADLATDPNDPLTYGPEVTAGPQAVDATGEFSLLDLLEGDYVVCATGTGAISPSCEIVTINGEDLLIVNNVDLPGMISAEITDTLGINEVQTYDDFFPFGQVSGGTYTITFDGSTTGSLDFDATAATVEAALEILPSINGDNVTVTGGPPNQGGAAIVIEFINLLASQDVPSITIDNTNLTGSGFVGYFVDPNLTDVDGAGQTHTLTADARVSGGTFTLTYDNGVDSPSTTAPLAFNATVTQIEVALNALSSINSGGGSVTVVSTDPDLIPGNEPITKAPVEVKFDGVMNADVNVLLVDNANLV